MGCDEDMTWGLFLSLLLLESIALVFCRVALAYKIPNSTTGFRNV